VPASVYFNYCNNHSNNNFCNAAWSQRIRFGCLKNNVVGLVAECGSDSDSDSDFFRIVARRLKITKFTANRKNIKIEYNRQQDNAPVTLYSFLGDRLYNSSAVAEMSDRGHNSHGPKRGGVLCPFRGALHMGNRLIQCGLPRTKWQWRLQPFGHNSVGCHSPHTNISTN